MVFLLSWMLSVGVIAVLWLAGNKNKRAWIIGVVIQVPWLVFDFLTGAYGLMPLAVILSYLYIRNYIKWSINDNT